MLFESDLRNDPAVRERVSAFLQACVSAIAHLDKAEAVQLMSALAWRGISGFPLQAGGSPIT